MSLTRRVLWKAATLLLALGLLVPAGVATAAAIDLDLAEAVCIADPEDAGNTRLLLRFNVPASLLGATIDLAGLRMTVLADAEGAADIETSVEAFPVSREWSAEDVAWDDGWESGIGSWDGAAGSFCDFVVRNGSVLRLDVTGIVQVWCHGEGANQGLVLVPFDPGLGALSGVQGQPSVRVFYSAPRVR